MTVSTANKLCNFTLRAAHLPGAIRRRLVREEEALRYAHAAMAGALEADPALTPALRAPRSAPSSRLPHEACPVSTGGGTRRVHSAREGRGEGGGAVLRRGRGRRSCRPRGARRWRGCGGRSRRRGGAGRGRGGVAWGEAWEQLWALGPRHTGPAVLLCGLGGYPPPSY